MLKFKSGFIRNDKRGTFVEVINSRAWRSIICGEMKSGAIMGNHYHKKTTVFFYLISGSAKINIVNIMTKKTEGVQIAQNEGIILSPNHSHAIIFKTDSSFILGKSQKYQRENPDTYPFIVFEDNPHINRTK